VNLRILEINEKLEKLLEDFRLEVKVRKGDIPREFFFKITRKILLTVEEEKRLIFFPVE